MWEQHGDAPMWSVAVHWVCRPWGFLGGRGQGHPRLCSAWGQNGIGLLKWNHPGPRSEYDDSPIGDQGQPLHFPHTSAMQLPVIGAARVKHLACKKTLLTHHQKVCFLLFNKSLLILEREEGRERERETSICCLPYTS